MICRGCGADMCSIFEHYDEDAEQTVVTWRCNHCKTMTQVVGE